jgi:hypothetical protein
MGGGFAHVQLARQEVGGQARPVLRHAKQLLLAGGRTRINFAQD